MIPEIPAEVTRLGENRGSGESRPLWESLGAFFERADSMPNPEWLIPDLVPGAGRLLVVAEPNAGKTLLAMVVAKAAAESGRTVYLILEEGGPKPTAGRLRDLGFDPSLPVKIAHLKNVTLKNDAAQLCTDIANEEDPVLFGDPWVSISGDAAENDTDAMKVQVALLEQVQRANPRALVGTLHHASKDGAAGNGSRAMASRGSTTLPAWADVVLYLEHISTPPGSGLVSFDATVAKNRDGERDHIIRVSISLGNGVVTYEPREEARRSEKDRKQAAKMDAMRIAVLEALAKHPDSGTGLVAHLGGNRASMFSLLRGLENEGVIRAHGHTWHLIQGSIPTVPTIPGDWDYPSQPSQGSIEPGRFGNGTVGTVKKP